MRPARAAPLRAGWAAVFGSVCLRQGALAPRLRAGWAAVFGSVCLRQGAPLRASAQAACGQAAAQAARLRLSEGSALC